MLLKAYDGSESVMIFGVRDFQQKEDYLVFMPRRGGRSKELKFDRIEYAAEIPAENSGEYIDRAIRKSISACDRVIINYQNRQDGNKLRNAVQRLNNERDSSIESLDMVEVQD